MRQVILHESRNKYVNHLKMCMKLSKCYYQWCTAFTEVVGYVNVSISKKIKAIVIRTVNVDNPKSKVKEFNQDE